MNRFGHICFIMSSDSSEESASKALNAGIRWIQYREKGKTKKEIYFEALRLRGIARHFDACFIVNDYADIALAVDADGVHLGQGDLPIKEARKIMGRRIIGISTHNLEEAVEAEKDGADYIGFGSIFNTSTKQDALVQGLQSLAYINKHIKIPVIAIGGININNALSVLNTGCYGVAVSSGLLIGDIEENAKRFLSIIKEAKK